MSKEQKYDSWHQQLAEAEASAEAPHDPWHATVSRLLPDLKGQKVLEVGCGRGDFAIWLAEEYPESEVCGVDFSEVAIATAEQRAKSRDSRAVFRVEDSQALSFADASFDCVISCECMEHVLDPVQM